MNGKQIKKLRQAVKMHRLEVFSEFAETINASPLKLRIKIAVKILRGRL